MAAGPFHFFVSIPATITLQDSALLLALDHKAGCKDWGRGGLPYLAERGIHPCCVSFSSRPQMLMLCWSRLHPRSISNRRCKLLLPDVPESGCRPDATKDINLNHSRSAGITTANGSSASRRGLTVPGPFGWSRDNGRGIA